MASLGGGVVRLRHASNWDMLTWQLLGEVSWVDTLVSINPGLLGGRAAGHCFVWVTQG